MSARPDETGPDQKTVDEAAAPVDRLDDVRRRLSAVDQLSAPDRAAALTEVQQLISDELDTIDEV